MAATETGHLAAREIDGLYRAHVAEVYRYAFAVLGNHADAEDVTQTTFLNAYRALEQGVRPRKPANWLLTIASNAIKQRFRHEQARPRSVELDERIAGAETEDEDTPTVGELLTALSKIPPQQRQAIVLREFEGRSYAEIAGILGVTTSALETLLFRARRSLAEELQHQLTCTEAQHAVSRSVDGRLGRKERRRLRDHLAECPDCVRFARLQQRNRSALRGLALVPIPVSLTLFKGFEGTASAAVVPLGLGSGTAATGAVVAGATGLGATATAGSTGGVLAGGVGLKVAAVVAAATVAGGTGVVGSTQLDAKPGRSGKTAAQPGQRLGQTAPRGVLVPGNGVAVGKATAPGQTQAGANAKNRRANAGTARRVTTPGASARATNPSAARKADATQRAVRARSQASTRAKPKAASTTPKATKPPAEKPRSSDAAPKTKPSQSAKPDVTVTRRAPGGGNGKGSREP
jgi:RNA polymerase sigma factor (sigma-70 family)